MKSPTQSRGFGMAKPSEYRFPRWLGNEKTNNRITERGRRTKGNGKKIKALSFASLEIAALWGRKKRY